MPAHSHVEAVLGFAGPLPAFAPFPPFIFEQGISSSQREQWLRVYVVIADRYLRSIPENFSNVSGPGSSLHTFLKTYYESIFTSPGTTSEDSTGAASRLRQQAFLLTRRLILEAKNGSQSLFNWRFLGQFCHAHLRTKSLAPLLQSLWKLNEAVLRKTLSEARSSMTSILESKTPDVVQSELKLIAPILFSLPQAGSLMAEGSEFLDALSAAYTAVTKSTVDLTVSIAYLSLSSLTRLETLNRSALIDHLYSLKSQAEAQKSGSSLLADLVTNTPLLAKLAGEPGEKGAERARTLALSLKSFSNPSIAKVRPTNSARGDKGKARAADSGAAEHHVHLLSKISQIQDLFPDLGSGFIAKLLDAYGEDVEVVTSHLLEDSLPPNLQNIDRSLQLSSDHAPLADSQSAIDSLIPETIAPSASTRRNVFDNDDFDRLAISSHQIHVGHRNTTDKILAQPQTAGAKASILSALAAIDSDDDEQDDTYDAADVGGTVDTAHPDGETPDKPSTTSSDPTADPEVEAQLFRAYTSDPSVFARSADTRRSPRRQALRSATGLTDEALEGWAVMVSRDPRRMRRMEERFAFDGAQQGAVGRSKWQAPTEDEEGGSGEDGPRRGGFGGRGGGRGRGRGRGRGNVSGPSGEADTQRARQRKGEGKARGANHSRREGRAKKMARAGFPG